LLEFAHKLRRIRPLWFITFWTGSVTVGAATAVILGLPADRAVETSIVLIGFAAVVTWMRPRPAPEYRLRDDREFRKFAAEFTDFESRVSQKLDKNQTSHYSRKHQLNQLAQRIESLAAEVAAGRSGSAEDEAATAAEFQALRSAVETEGRAVSERLESLIARVAEMERTISAHRLAVNADRLRQNMGAELVPLERELRLVRSSPLFDADHYVSQLDERPADPVEHYVLMGSDLGYDPHPLFDDHFYRRHDPRTTVTHRSGLGHFLDPDTESPGDPCPMFDAEWYGRQVGGAADARQAVLHYIEKGDRAGVDPSPLFDNKWYREHFGNIIPASTSALAHYLTEGRDHGWMPNAVFDREALSTALELPHGADVAAEVAKRLRELDGEEPERPARPTTEYWKWFNLATGRHRQEDTFALYRILGNDLPPRHQSGQTYDNLKFILENEPRYMDCRKIWILNRIIDTEAKSRLVELLEEHGAEYIDIPIDRDEYRSLGWNFRGLADQYPSYGPDFHKHFAQNHAHRYLEHIYHDKNLYLINNNGARNAALEHGRGLAKWVLPWDGNCFMTESAWDELRNYVSSNSHLRYVLVPLARLTQPNEALLDRDFTPAAEDEPQIIFRCDSEARFNPHYRYGHRPKVELFRRLGIPGNWDRWPVYTWDPEPVVEEREFNAWGRASWVARLYSGNPELEKAVSSGLRGRSRGEGLRMLIDRYDAELLEERFSSSKLFTLDDDAFDPRTGAYRSSGGEFLEGVSDHLVASARARLDDEPHSILDKTTAPPSRDPQDYWNPAPYWWPDPSSPNGLPYVKRDGRRAPGTILGSEGSQKYDRTALQRMIDETFVNALAYGFTGERIFAQKAAAQIRTWFVDPARRMNPHLRYAQVQLGHNENLGKGQGILETKDFYYLLDGIRLVERSGALSGADSAELRSWFGQFREWLVESAPGRTERGAPNNHGTWYDVQLAAIDAFLGDAAGLQATFRRTLERVGRQFAPGDGEQTEELKRTLSQHYCAYNISGWMVLNDQARHLGISLKDFRFPGRSGLREALEWIGDHGARPWPFEQIEPFDEDRFQAIGWWAAASGLIDRPWEWLREPGTVKPVFSVHCGIRPYWMLANPSIDVDAVF
jgi:hypothetical protein